MSKIAIDKKTGTLFDDFVPQEFEDFTHDTWTQVCDKCSEEHRLPYEQLDLNSGHGICGVLGCNRKSDHYYDFDREEKEFKDE